MVSPF